MWPQMGLSHLQIIPPPLIHGTIVFHECSQIWGLLAIQNREFYSPPQREELWGDSNRLMQAL